MRSLIVYGPPASGKTRSAQALARHFGLTDIVDAEAAPSAREMHTASTLYLCQDRPPESLRSVRVLHIDEAKRQAGLS